MARRPLIVAALGGLALVLVVVAAVAAVRALRPGPDTRLEEAFAAAPDDGARYSWTDWAGVRRELGLDGVTDPTTADVQKILDLGFDADLVSTTALGESAQVLQAQFGFSPASLDWELFSQSETGAVVVMRLPDAVGSESDEAVFDEIEQRLTTLGYPEPDSPTGVWRGTPTTLAQVGSVTPELTFVALDADRRLVITSDTLTGAEAGVDAAGADELPEGGLGEVVADAGSPLSAAVYTGDQACASLSMGQADATDQDQGEELLAAAGEVNAMTGFAMGTQPGGDVRVSMAFDSAERARTNADTRAVLASGPAPGQGGDFGDRFTLGPVTADGTVVRMALERAEGAFVLSDLSTGPVLFATC